MSGFNEFMWNHFPAAAEILDLDFYISDLNDDLDVRLDPHEQAQNYHYDATCSRQESGHRYSGGSNPYTGDDTPIGKTVI